MASGYSLYSFCRYTTFGSPMPNRSFSASRYKYGFNGQEKDDEVAGSGNINTAMYWEYDSRLGRRWNIDPEYRLFAYESPYAAFHNNPVFYNDPLGNKPGNPEKEAKKFGKKVDKAMKSDESLTRDEAITKVGQSLSDKNRYITRKEANINGTDHATYDIVQYYKTLSVDINKASSTASKVENPMTQTLDKSTKTTFDEAYSVTPVAGAISTSIELKNIGKSDGLVTLTYDSKGSSEPTVKDVTVPAGQTKNVPLLKNTTYIQIEYQIESIDKPGVAAKIDMKINSDVLKPNPNATYEPYRTQGPPTKQGILQYFNK